jgi:hypothetical protein
MAKKSNIGNVLFIRDKPRKRPGRHAKKYSKRKPNRKKSRGQG